MPQVGYGGYRGVGAPWLGPCPLRGSQSLEHGLGTPASTPVPGLCLSPEHGLLRFWRNWQGGPHRMRSGDPLSPGQGQSRVCRGGVQDGPLSGQVSAGLTLCLRSQSSVGPCSPCPATWLRVHPSPSCTHPHTQPLGPCRRGHTPGPGGPARLVRCWAAGSPSLRWTCLGGTHSRLISPRFIASLEYNLNVITMMET